MKNRYLHQPLFFLGLGALAAVGLIPVASAQQAQADADPSIAASLIEQLSARGWQSTRAADGSVTLAPGPEPEYEPESDPEQPQAPPANDAAVAAAVTPEAPPAGDDGQASAGGESTAGLAEQLKAKLIAAGWVMHTDADGSVTLTQPVAEAPPLDVAEVVEVAAEPAAPPTAKPPSLADDLKARLEAAGWVTHTDADGSVTLTQPVDEAPAVDVTELAEVAGEPDAPAAAEPPSLADDLKARLETAGWVTHTDADGSVTLTQPVDAQPEALPTDAFSVCPGTSPRDNGDLPAAPIDTWAKARQVARAWRDQHLPGTVVVGLIREVPRLYIASLVSNDEARELQHLIAIRKRNGEVLVID